MDSECVHWTLVRQLAKSQGCNQCYVNWQVKAPLLCALPPLRGPARLQTAAPSAAPHRLFVQRSTHKPQRSWEGRRGRRANVNINQEAQTPRVRRNRPAGRKKMVLLVEFKLFLMGQRPWSTRHFTRTTPATVSDANAEAQSQRHFL